MRSGAWALGMTPAQVLRHGACRGRAVIMAGIRTGRSSTSARRPRRLYRAGGLGDPIAAGLALSDTRMILSGALPAALLALLVDGVLGVGERIVAPRG